jgi:hypothetical protein
MSGFLSRSFRPGPVATGSVQPALSRDLLITMNGAIEAQTAPLDGSVFIGALSRPVARHSPLPALLGRSAVSGQ